MILQNGLVTVSNCQGMFGPDHKLIRIAGMLEIVHQTPSEDS